MNILYLRRPLTVQIQQEQLVTWIPLLNTDAIFLHLLYYVGQQVILLLMSEQLNQVLPVVNHSVTTYNVLCTAPNPPVIDEVVNISTSAVRVTWISPTMPNGIITIYTITYNNSTNVTVPYNRTNVSKIIITKLLSIKIILS